MGGLSFKTSCLTTARTQFNPVSHRVLSASDLWTWRCVGLQEGYGGKGFTVQNSKFEFQLAATPNLESNSLTSRPCPKKAFAKLFDHETR